MPHPFIQRRCCIFILLGCLVGGNAPLWAQEPQSDLKELREEVRELRKSNQEKDRKLEQLEKRIDSVENRPAPAAVKSNPADSALDRAVQDLDQKPTAVTTPSIGLFSQPMGSAATVRLIDVSFDVLMNTGGSTENDRSLQSLQGGDHDPRKRGFTLGQAELSLAGAVDPYVTGEAHIVYKIDALSGDSEVELEEAFLKTTSLPWGLQLKAGHYLTEFGRINPTHPHAWLWIDQPLIATRLFGSDGQRSPGARLAWLTPLPWFTEVYFGVQNANGSTSPSFLSNADAFAANPVGGRPFFDRPVNGLAELLYSTRLVTSTTLGNTVTSQLGFSGLLGPNASGTHGKTQIYGSDLVVKWKPTDNFRGWPFVTFESEFMYRLYHADPSAIINDPANPLVNFSFPQDTLKDYGLYAQVLYGFYPQWAVGTRYEFVSGKEPSFVGRNMDPLRDDRHRISPLIAWYLSEFTRLRLQYNFDHAQHLPGEHANSVWGGVEFLFGTHPAHKF